MVIIRGKKVERRTITYPAYRKIATTKTTPDYCLVKFGKFRWELIYGFSLILLVISQIVLVTRRLIIITGQK
jgi:hypothetical protein